MLLKISLPTLSMKRLYVVVVNLKCCITAASRKPNDMIIVIVDFHTNLTQR